MRAWLTRVWVSPTRWYFAVLEHTQQLRLQVERQLADLVEEERALAGILEVPGLRLGGSGECAARIAEERGFHQRGRYRRAVEREERMARARTQVMQRERDALLAAPRLALDQCRKTRGGVEVDLAPQPAQRRAVADERARVLRPVVGQLERRGLQRPGELAPQHVGLARLGHQVHGTEGRARGARSTPRFCPVSTRMRTPGACASRSPISLNPSLAGAAPGAGPDRSARDPAFKPARSSSTAALRSGARSTS
jgi:hypothetical protein